MTIPPYIELDKDKRIITYKVVSTDSLVARGEMVVEVELSLEDGGNVRDTGSDLESITIAKQSSKH